jgi:hypothetical protein
MFLLLHLLSGGSGVKGGVAAEGTTLKKVWAPQSQWWPSFALNLGVCCQRFHKRGQFHWKSCLEVFSQRLAGLAEESKMFALAICLVLKTFLDNARALVENSVLSLLGWSQEGCFECK